MAAVEVLENAGVRIDMIDRLAPSGWAASSAGFLEEATEQASTNVEALAPLVNKGYSIVYNEPSDAVPGRVSGPA